MDIFIRNISHSANVEDVKNVLSPLIHRPPFPIDPPINFDVRTLRKKGCAILTFPQESHSNTFLNAFSRGVDCKGRRMQFSASKNPPDPGVLSWLQRRPWQDPQEVERVRVKQRELSAHFPLRSFSFGRLCRDLCFSPEETHTHEIEVFCDQNERKICVWQSRKADDFIFGGRYEVTAWYRAAQVRAIVVSPQSEDEHYALLEANTHPTIQAKLKTFSEDLEDALSSLFGDTQEPPAQRWSSWGGHGAMLPIARLIRLDFRSRVDLLQFIECCKPLHHHRVIIRSILCRKRDLYASGLKLSVGHLMGSLPFELAFALDQAITSGILDYQEAQDLAPDLSALVRDQGTNAGPIFRSFALALGSIQPSLLRLGSEVQPTPPTQAMRRRGRRRRRNQSATELGKSDSTLKPLSQLLHDAVVQFQIDRIQARNSSLISAAPRAAVYQCYRLILTPTCRSLEGPLPDMSSDILRQFGHHECFLRVTFQDENRGILRGDYPTLDIKELLNRRYKTALTGGLKVAGRRYEFLGYSMSALREHTVVFLHPFVDENGDRIDANVIRNRLGDFSKVVRYPALLGARWSQAFSATERSIDLQENEIDYDLPDIENVNSCFTDGVGVISTALLRDAWEILRPEMSSKAKLPSAIQIRFGGAKGVLTHDPTLKGRVAAFRPSQTKYSAPSNRTLNIAAFSRPIKTFLNRPLIMLLEHGGVDPSIFISLQKAAVDDVERIRTSFTHAAMLVGQHGLCGSYQLPSLLNNLVHQLDIADNAVNSLGCAIIEKCLDFSVTHVLREIKFRAHIPVPGSYTLIGVADEWNCLEEGEVYVRIVDKKNKVSKCLLGKLLVTRSPQIHPGDIQFATGVDRPELRHLENVIVFSCRGKRSLPSCLGGGDLDGDIYNIIEDPQLFPARVTEPGSYIPLPRKQRPDGMPCTVEDVAEFVINYLQTDLVGQISILHLRISDTEGAGCESCMKLAEYASHAVDFPKTGTPVDFKNLPRPPSRLKPDFLAQEIVDPTTAASLYYPSEKILGRLYRNIPLRDEDYDDGRGQSFGDIIWQRLLDLEPELSTRGLASNTFLDENASEEETLLWEEMEGIMAEYIEELTTIAKSHTLSKRVDDKLTEAELVSGTIQAKWADHRKRREAVAAMNLQTQVLAQAIRRELRRLPPDPTSEDDGYEAEPDLDEDAYYEPEELSERDISTFQRALVAWNVAAEAVEENPDRFGPSSFGLIALGMMLKILKKARKY